MSGAVTSYLTAPQLQPPVMGSFVSDPGASSVAMATAGFRKDVSFHGIGAVSLEDTKAADLFPPWSWE